MISRCIHLPAPISFAGPLEAKSLLRRDDLFDHPRGVSLQQCACVPPCMGLVLCTAWHYIQAAETATQISPPQRSRRCCADIENKAYHTDKAQSDALQADGLKYTACVTACHHTVQMYKPRANHIHLANSVVLNGMQTQGTRSPSYSRPAIHV